MTNLVRKCIWAALLFGVIGRASAQTYDATAQFKAGWNAGSNPNGVWSYGYSTSLSSKLNLYTNTATSSINGGNELFWYSPSVDSGFDPTVALNNGPAVNDGNVNFVANELVLTGNPGTNGYSHVVFTAPSSGNYSIEAGFRVDQNGASADVNVLGNGALLFSNYISGVGTTTSYSGTVSLSAGQTIDFAVDNPNGYQNTGMSATVTFELAPPLTPLHVFDNLNSTTDGVDPVSGVIQGKDGNFYGTTLIGGTPPGFPVGSGRGTVFKMTPSGVVTTLYSFSGPDGLEPWGGLIQGKDGNLYGTTAEGGTFGSGTVFKITTSGTLTTLYNFSATDANGDNADGAFPLSSLIQGKDGNLYGVTDEGGTSGSGTVFKITTSGTLTTLYTFSAIVAYGENSDGAYPIGSLLQGTDGNLYGVTVFGGTFGYGTVFKITTSGTLTTLYAFSALDANDDNSDGAEPTGSLIQGTDGNLYGTTYAGGTSGSGTVFKITTSGVLTTLHSFSATDANGDNSDGAEPFTGLIQGKDGNLYGTTYAGGTFDYGTVYQITTTGALTPIHNFSYLEGDPYYAGLFQGNDGNIYGTTSFDENGNGTVYKLTMIPIVDSTNVTTGTAGTSITITGANFTEAYSVWLGARAAKFTVNSDSSLTIVIPNNPGVSRIYVFNPFGIGYGLPFTITP